MDMWTWGGAGSWEEQEDWDWRLYTCFSVKSCLTLYDPTGCSMLGFSVLDYLPEFAQTHVHWVDNAIQQFHPLSPPFLSALNLSQHQDLFQWVSSLHQVAKVLELQLQHQSFQQILELSGRLYFWRWLCQYIPAHILFFFKKFNFLFYVKNPCQQWKQTKSIKKNYFIEVWLTLK